MLYDLIRHNVQKTKLQQLRVHLDRENLNIILVLEKSGNLKKKWLNFRNLIKGEIYPGILLLDPMVFPVYCCILYWDLTS